MKKKMLISTLIVFIATFGLMNFAQAKCHGKKWEDKDTNKDGVIDQQEYMAAKMKYFDMRDTNKDGSISKDEAKARAQEKFNKMDANKDGKITVEEKKAYRKSKCASEKK